MSMSCDFGRLGSIFRVVVQRIIGILVLWEELGREVTPAKKTAALLVSRELCLNSGHLRETTISGEERPACALR